MLIQPRNVDEYIQLEALKGTKYEVMIQRFRVAPPTDEQWKLINRIYKK
jgi:hypothetical protein